MSSYCLYCFGALPKEGTPCPACGRPDLVSLRQRYWNRPPRLMALQRWIIRVSFVITVVVCVLASLYIPGRPSGAVVLLTIFFHGMVVVTASKLTRDSPYFRPTLFWSLVFLGSGIGLGIVHSWLWFALVPLAALSWKSGAVGARWKKQLQS